MKNYVDEKQFKEDILRERIFLQKNITFDQINSAERIVSIDFSVLNECFKEMRPALAN